MTTTTRVFTPNAVLIPEAAIGHRGQVDPDECTLLYLDEDEERLKGGLFTKEAWESEGAASFVLWDTHYYRVGEETPFCRAGLRLSDQEPVPFPRIQLLPDMWVLKRDETYDWDGLDTVRIRRVFGVYVLNKRAAHYLCELTASYELHRFESQYEPAWTSEEDEHGTLHEKAADFIREGEVHDEDVCYMHCSDVEQMLKHELQERAGDLPDGISDRPETAGDRRHAAGGYKLTVLESVTEEDALEEIRERLLPNGDL